MKVLVFPADAWGCGHYRLIWPALALKDQGHDVDVIMPGSKSGIQATTVDGRIVSVGLSEDAEADVYVFQRPTNVLLSQLITNLRTINKTVVVDMDDDLSCIHPKNAAFHMLHPRRSPNNNWLHAQEGCRHASLVTVSTPALVGRYGVRSNNRVLRNCVPRAFLEIERSDVEHVWGWAGALHSHPDDLPIIGGAVSELTRRGHKFKIVGYTEGTGRALGLPEDPPGTGRVEFEHWAEALAELRVGVAPLADTKFNKMKSWLKPLEYASLGIPWVANDRDEYRVLFDIAPGGWLVNGNRTRGWVQAVNTLMSNDSVWNEHSELVKDMARRCVIEDHAWRWLETWETAWKLDHQAAATVIT